MIDKVILQIAKVLSGITFPLLMPSYAMLLIFTTTYLSYLPGSAFLSVMLVTIGVTVMLPVIAIYILSARGIIKDPLLNNRGDRTIPYGVTILCYVGLAVYLWKISAPDWMIAFTLAGAAVLMVLVLINLGWKISGHAAGMGALTALMLYLSYKGFLIWPGVALPCLMILLSGLVATSRLLLGRHNLAQIAAGYFLSLGAVLVTLIIAH